MNIIIPPQEYHRYCQRLCLMIPPKTYKYVYGIPRGGLPIAVYIAHYHDIEIIRWLDIKDCMLDTSKVLIVDDIADTGNTLYLHVNIHNCDTAVLFIKPQSLFSPTYNVIDVDNEPYYLFPYEQK